jgi:hypothetical protein
MLSSKAATASSKRHFDLAHPRIYQLSLASSRSRIANRKRVLTAIQRHNRKTARGAAVHTL